MNSHKILVFNLFSSYLLSSTCIYVSQYCYINVSTRTYGKRKVNVDLYSALS